MVSANQINGVENMYDRPDVSPFEKKLIDKVLQTENGPIEVALKKHWDNIGKQYSDIENGKVTPR
uniref:Uncharacterized protein n=1 Tax=Ochrobactrum phage ORM_20 TaxID=2985243 RepID=A0A9N6WZI6_9VIRU|nr:hypothetical protein ORM20_00155 [Ochrobactrum phage ORM_20]